MCPALYFWVVPPPHPRFFRIIDLAKFRKVIQGLQQFTGKIFNPRDLDLHNADVYFFRTYASFMMDSFDFRDKVKCHMELWISRRSRTS